MIMSYQKFFPTLDSFFEDKKDVTFLINMRKAYNEVYKPKDDSEWFLTQHLRLGMAIRNQLRNVQPDCDVGGNWDDHYVYVLNAYLDSKIQVENNPNPVTDYADYNKLRREELMRIIKPIEDYMNKFCCPHDKLIVTQGNAELLSGELSIPLEVLD
jgi:hypothetical protein